MVQIPPNAPATFPSCRNQPTARTTCANRSIWPAALPTNSPNAPPPRCAGCWPRQRVTALVAAPILLATLAVGLVVGVIQAATSVNEQTLTFVPKLVVVAAVLVLLGGAMFGLIGDFAREIMAEIAGISTQ